MRKRNPVPQFWRVTCPLCKAAQTFTTCLITGDFARQYSGLFDLIWRTTPRTGLFEKQPVCVTCQHPANCLPAAPERP